MTVTLRNTMLKSLIGNYQTSLKRSFAPGWLMAVLLILIVTPLAIFVLMFLFEGVLTDWLMRIEPPSPLQARIFYIDIIRLSRLEVLWTGAFSIAFFLLFAYPTRTALLSVFSTQQGRVPYQMMLLTFLAVAASLFVAQY